MRSLRDLSGPWVGFWVQGRVRGAMRLTIRFGDATLTGEGTDPIGPFTLDGRHDAAGIVGFAKTYGSHRVAYEGRWDGAMIAGTWRIRATFAGTLDRGEFEIWPERDDEAIARMETALAATG